MIWKKVKRNENYSINALGEVRNDLTGKIKKPTRNKSNGYLFVDLYMNNKRTKETIHRLVAEAFIPNLENKQTVDHRDGDRTNNSVENLRWATYSENNSRFNSVGVRSQKVKVTHYIEKRKKRGGGHEEWLGIDNVMFFDRISDVAEYFNLTISNISLLLKEGNIGRRGKTRGYKFEYLDGKRATF
jgi:hypothetical protein